MISIKIKKEDALLNIASKGKSFIFNQIYLPENARYKGKSLANAWFFSFEPIKKEEGDFINLKFPLNHKVLINQIEYDKEGIPIKDLKEITVEAKVLKEIIEMSYMEDERKEKERISKEKNINKNKFEDEYVNNKQEESYENKDNYKYKKVDEINKKITEGIEKENKTYQKGDDSYEF